ncbi:hypothetical protein GCM10009780_15120 [Actinomadura alba]
MVERAARRVVEEIVASAPAGWSHAVLASTAGRGGVSVSGGYAVPGAPLWRNPVPSPFMELERLAEAVREVRGWERTSLEIVCRPSGEYGLVAFADVITSLRGRGGGFQAVLDPGYRLPQPGSGQEEGTTAPAGDPELAVARFREYMERRAAILGRPEQLPPPASAAALNEAERRIGRPLPADLRALYLIADGDGIGYEHRYLLGGNAWLALEDLVADHADQHEPVWFGWELAWDSVVFDAEPPDTVRRRGGHPAWLPFGTGEDGNYLAVDLAPARNGHPGQVIRIGRDYDGGPAYLADSVTSLLGRHLELLEQGAYEAERRPHLPTGTRPQPRPRKDRRRDPRPGPARPSSHPHQRRREPGRSGPAHRRPEPAAAAPQPLRRRRPGAGPRAARRVPARHPGRRQPDPARRPPRPHLPGPGHHHPDRHRPAAHRPEPALPGPLPRRRSRPDRPDRPARPALPGPHRAAVDHPAGRGQGTAHPRRRPPGRRRRPSRRGPDLVGAPRPGHRGRAPHHRHPSHLKRR